MTRTSHQGSRNSIVRKAKSSELPILGSSSPNIDVSASQSTKPLYEEIQADELIALASIYGEDFTRLASTHVAWNKSEPCFEIRIKSSDENLAVTLHVILTASYPKSPPLLSLKYDRKLKDSIRLKLQQVIETKPKELAVEEQPMVMQIVDACTDVLEDAAQVEADSRNIPSLEMERSAHEIAATKLAQEARKLEEEQRQIKSQEEERLQETLVQTEISRQKAKAREVKQKSRPPILFPGDSLFDLNLSGQTDYEAVCFEQPITILDADRNPIIFQAVTNKIFLRQGPSSSCYTVKPAIARTPGDLPTLVLKQNIIASESGNKDVKTQVQLIESSLRSLRNIDHRNVLEIFDFRVHRTVEESGEVNSGWTISILTEFAEKGSLQEFIEIAGSIGLEKARLWTVELLDALRFLHENGIVHENIHPGNILLVRSFSGEVRVKLADSSYQRKLHNLTSKIVSSDLISVSRSTCWIPPEIVNKAQPIFTQKTDIWDFGILFLQMIFGLKVIENYSSPTVLVDSLALSMSLRELILMIFMTDYKKRPRAVELSPSEFLATDASIYERISESPSCFNQVLSIPQSDQGKIRGDSMNRYSSQCSRYREDFVEMGRLGKGGFGEVVKARKRLDGQIYAIKKIVQRSSTSLTEVLKEVHLLSQLSHPSVVRYYNTWTEEVSDEFGNDENITTTNGDEVGSLTNELLVDADSSIEYWDHTEGLDFMSSSKYLPIEFGYDESTDEDEEVENLTASESSVIKKVNENKKKLDFDGARSHSQRYNKIVLYISMEYCEKQTLRDLIKRELHKDTQDIWRLFGEILEGLMHIHSLNIVHRDLKPENIFINAATNVKIGDFGLATSGQYTMTDKTPNLLQHSTNMTRNIGTAFYVAPEAKTAEGGTYTSKIDMYSLGIIFFEMCYRPLVPGMDRATIGEGLRNIKPTLPDDFRAPEKQAQTDIILSLLTHNPEKRPSSSELLQNGKLPLKMENKSIQKVLYGLADCNSPYREKMIKTLFSLENDWAKDHAWEMEDLIFRSPDLLLLRSLVKQKLVDIFRHHGALETTRTILFPRSSYYGSNALTLLDEHGTVLQLPYDLTLPYARIIAKHQPTLERSFAFGQVFRDRQTGGQPQTFGEVDFDIVSTTALDASLKEAEVIKVLDEIVGSFPSLTKSKMCFHINHSDLLSYVFDFCKIEPSIRHAVANTLSKLNFQSWNWQKIQIELRSPLIALSAPSIDDLQRFDIKDNPKIAFEKLKVLFEGTEFFEKASPAIMHLQEVIEYTKRFEVKNKIYVTPLGSLNEKFYKGGVFFTCLFDQKVSDVFAVGGQYDSLVQEHRHKTSGETPIKHAVGFNLAWEKIARCPKASIRSFHKKIPDDYHDIWKTKRCDVLVASHDASILRTVGISLLQILWSNSISAELARDSHSPEDLLSKYRSDQHSWIIIIKQDSVLKVKSMDRRDIGDVDISSSQLLSFLKTEMRERDRKYGTQYREKLQQTGNVGEAEYEQDVRVLIAGTKTKKSNRRKIVEQAQSCALSLTHDMLTGPIVAIETTDQVMELIQGTRLSESETWRSALQMVPISERRYLGEVHDMLLNIKEQNANITRNTFVYNFRTGKCIYYDLGL